MDQKTTEKLTALYGGDSEGLQAFLSLFEDQVDGVNRTIKDKNLVHRAQGDKTTDAPAGDAAAATTDAAAEEDTGDDTEIVIDDETVGVIVAQVVQSKDIQAIVKGVAALQKMVGDMIVERDKDKKEISRLNGEVDNLNKDDNQKLQEKVQDLPRNRRTYITHRPREMNDALDGEPAMDAQANRTLNGIPASSRY